MSALGGQIRALRESASGPSGVLQKRKGRASLLLSPDDAADVDVNTVREAALEGLQSLAAADERFAQFEITLFSKEAQARPREQQTPDANARIDQSLAALLRLVSPFFLHRPAHMVLEYLVRHYSVHRHNVDDLMRCVLPWHDTRLFARAVQLIVLKGTRWGFLRPTLKTGTPLPRAALARQLAEDTALLQFLCELVQSAPQSGKGKAATQQFPHLYSFFSAVVLESMDYSIGLREASVRTLVPVLLKGIAASRRPDFQLACYLVTARLALKAPLGGPLTDSLLQAVGKCRCAGGLEPQLLCLLALTQKKQQGAAAVLSPVSFDCVARLEGLPSALAAATTEYDVTSLLRLLAFGYVERLEAGPASALSLVELLGDSAWRPDALRPLVGEVAAAVVDACRRAAELPEGPKEADRAKLALFREGCRAAISSLWQRFPEEASEAIDATMRALQAGGDPTRAEALFSLLEDSVAGRGMMGPEGGGGSLLLALEHPSPAVRVQAIARAEQILSTLADGGSGSGDEEGGSSRDAADGGLGAALLRRVGDADASVIVALLGSEKVAETIAALEEAAAAPGSPSVLEAACSALAKWRASLFEPDVAAAPAGPAAAAVGALLRFLSGPLLAERPASSLVVIGTVLAYLPSPGVAAASKAAAAAASGSKAERKARRAAVMAVCAAAVAAAAATGYQLLENLPAEALEDESGSKGAADAAAALQHRRSRHAALEVWGQRVVDAVRVNIVQSYAAIDLKELLKDADANAWRLLLEAASAALDTTAAATAGGAKLADEHREQLAALVVSCLVSDVRGCATAASWAVRCLGVASVATSAPPAEQICSVIWEDHTAGGSGAETALEVLLVAASVARAEEASPASSGDEAFTDPATEALTKFIEHRYGGRLLPVLAAVASSAGFVGGASEEAAAPALCVAATLVQAAAAARSKAAGAATAADVVATLPCFIACLGKQQQDTREAAFLFMKAVIDLAAARTANAKDGGAIAAALKAAFPAGRGVAASAGAAANKTTPISLVDFAGAASLVHAVVGARGKVLVLDRGALARLLSLAFGGGSSSTGSGGGGGGKASATAAAGGALASAQRKAVLEYLVTYACRLGYRSPSPARLLISGLRGFGLESMWTPASALLRHCLTVLDSSNSSGSSSSVGAAGGGTKESQDEWSTLALVLMELLGLKATAAVVVTGRSRGDWGEYAGELFGLYKAVLRCPARRPQASALRLIINTSSSEGGGGLSEWCMNVLTEEERCELLLELLDLLRTEPSLGGDGSLATDAVVALPVDPAVIAALLSSIASAADATAAAATAAASPARKQQQQRSRRKASPQAKSSQAKPLANDTLSEPCAAAVAEGAARLVQRCGSWIAAMTAVLEFLLRKGPRGYLGAGSWALVTPLFTCLRELLRAEGGGGSDGSGSGSAAVPERDVNGDGRVVVETDASGALAFCQGLVLDALAMLIRQEEASEPEPPPPQRKVSIDAKDLPPPGSKAARRAKHRSESVDSVGSAGRSPGRVVTRRASLAAAPPPTAAYLPAKAAEDSGVVLECLRRSQRPQTRNSAVTLVAAMAQAFPKELAPCVLPIFQEIYAAKASGFSFQLAQRALDAVLHSLRKFGGSAGVTVGVVAAVLVSAFPTIPLENRNAVFRLVMRCLGPEALAALPIALLAQAVADEGKGGGVEASVEFGRHLCSIFQAKDQLAGMLDMVHAAHRLAVAAALENANASDSTTSSQGGAAAAAASKAALAEAAEEFQRPWGEQPEPQAPPSKRRSGNANNGRAAQRDRDLLALPLSAPAADGGKNGTDQASLRAFYVVDVRELLLTEGSKNSAQGGGPGATEALTLTRLEHLLLLLVRDQLGSNTLRTQANALARSAHSGNPSSKGKKAGGTSQQQAAASERKGVAVQRGFLLLCEALLLLLQTAETIPQAQSGQSAHQMAYEVLDALQSLLEVPALVALVQELLEHENPRLRRKAVQMLNARMASAEAAGGFTAEEAALFLEMVPNLRAIIVAAGPATTTKEVDREGAIGLQAALLAVDALVGALGSRHADAFIGVLDDVEALVAGLPLPRGDVTVSVANTAFFSLATLMAKLGPRALSKLTVFFPAVLAALEWCGGISSPTAEGNEAAAAAPPLLPARSGSRAVRVLCASALSSVATVATRLPQFLSPYLRRLLAVVLLPTVVGSSDVHVAGNADAVLNLLVQGVPMRALLPAIVESRETCAKHGSAALGALFTFAADALGHMGRADVPAHLSRLADFFADALDNRRVAGVVAAGGSEAAESTMTSAEVEMVEEKATAALVALVLRLNEKELLPLFLRLCEWKGALAAADPTAAGGVDAAALRSSVGTADRYIAFFAAVERLVSTFKVIFVPYFDHILEDCTSALLAASGAKLSDSGAAAAAGDAGGPRSSKRRKSDKKELAAAAAAAAGSAGGPPPLDAERSLLLLRRVLLSLHHCFRFDAGEFMDAGRFERLRPPLVALLEAPALLAGGDAAYLAFVTEVLAPCIGQLAAAARKDTLYKPLLHTVLLHARAERARVREAAVVTAEACFAAVGEDLLALLPECLPFLSEGLEDEDAGVVAACRRLIRLVESTLGESIESYLA